MGNKTSKFDKKRPPPQSHDDCREKNPFTIVAAIDLGTYACGYAYQHIVDFEDKKPAIHVLKRSHKLIGHKIPTCLLLKPDKSLDSFGISARDKYYKFKTPNGKSKPEKYQDYLYIEHFKMTIYHRTANLIRDDLPVETSNGKSVPAIDVFTMTIEYLKNTMLDRLKTDGVLQSESSNYDFIKWVITIPAIWEVPATTLMYRAAIKAGISEKCLVLALEPECAAIHCKQLPRGSLDICGDNSTIERVVEPGSTVMVVDIGGGTVDIAVMMIKDDGTMEHVHKSGGNHLGGKQINDKILQELKRIFGGDVMQEFCNTHGRDEQELLDEIEKSKCTWWKRNGVNDEFNIKFSSHLESVWKKHNDDKDLDQHLQKHNVTREVGYLMLDPNKVKALFNECIEGILKFLKDVMSDRSCTGVTINALLAVGGFAESDYLIERLRAKLRDKGIPVIRPEDPELSVMKGAVLYGLDEGIISSRIMRHTYGVAMTITFDRDRHDESAKYVENGVEMANNVFRKHVEVGEKISVQKWIRSKEYCPDPHNKTQRIYIFKSDKENPRHTTEDDGSICIGQFDVDFPTAAKRKINIEFYFAGTVIKVRAINDDKTVQDIQIFSP